MHKQAGFSLFEIVLFIIVVGISLGGISIMFLESSTQSYFPYQQQRAIAMANTYMDEIFHKRWDESTPIGGGCVETGSNYCTNFCAALTYPDCGQCASGAGVCLPAANAVANCNTGANCGPDGEARIQYDDVDDYQGHVASPPEDADGTPIVDYNNYTITVNVSSPNAAWNGIPASDVKQIDVTVTTPGPGNDTYTLSAFRVNY